MDQEKKILIIPNDDLTYNWIDVTNPEDLAYVELLANHLTDVKHLIGVCRQADVPCGESSFANDTVNQ